LGNEAHDGPDLLADSAEAPLYHLTISLTRLQLN
jgi:hypothetical protein